MFGPPSLCPMMKNSSSNAQSLFEVFMRTVVLDLVVVFFVSSSTSSSMSLGSGVDPKQFSTRMSRSRSREVTCRRSGVRKLQTSVRFVGGSAGPHDMTSECPNYNFGLPAARLDRSAGRPTCPPAYFFPEKTSVARGWNLFNAHRMPSFISKFKFMRAF